MRKNADHQRGKKNFFFGPTLRAKGRTHLKKDH